MENISLVEKMSYEEFLKSDFGQMTLEIQNIENVGIRAKTMYIIMDTIRRMKSGECDMTLPPEEQIAHYGVSANNDGIIDYGNVDANYWKAELLKNFNIRC